MIIVGKKANIRYGLGIAMIAALLIGTAFLGYASMVSASALHKPVDQYMELEQYNVKKYDHIEVTAMVLKTPGDYDNLVLVLHFNKRGSGWRVEWYTAKVSSQSGAILNTPDNNPFSYYPRKHYASHLTNLFPFVHGVSNMGSGSFYPVYNHLWKNSNWKITKTQSYVQWTIACGKDSDYGEHDVGAAYDGGYVVGKKVYFSYSDHETTGWWIITTGSTRVHYSWDWTIEN